MKKLILILILNQSLQICAQSPTENKLIATKYFEEVINQQKVELIPQLFSEKFKYYDMHTFKETEDNLESFKKIMQGFFRAFPDTHYSINNMIAEGDKVFVEIVFSATHKGDFMGIKATNKLIKISECYLMILKQGKIVESRRLIDFSAFFDQLMPKK